MLSNSGISCQNRASMALRWVHLAIGIICFFVFTTTGSYMRSDFPDKDAIPQEFRILMRSRHIYILFSALIHLALGVYFQLRTERWRKIVQVAGSIVLLISTVYLVRAFVVETYSTQHFTDLSRSGIYASLAGIVLHLIGGLRQKHDG